MDTILFTGSPIKGRVNAKNTTPGENNPSVFSPQALLVGGKIGILRTESPDSRSNSISFSSDVSGRVWRRKRAQKPGFEGEIVPIGHVDSFSPEIDAFPVMSSVLLGLPPNSQRVTWMAHRSEARAFLVLQTALATSSAARSGLFRRQVDPQGHDLQQLAGRRYRDYCSCDRATSSALPRRFRFCPGFSAHRRTGPRPAALRCRQQYSHRDDNPLGRRSLPDCAGIQSKVLAVGIDCSGDSCRRIFPIPAGGERYGNGVDHQPADSAAVCLLLRWHVSHQFFSSSTGCFCMYD